MGRKVYTREFKVEAVALAERIGFVAASTELGVCDGSLYTWRQKLKEDGDDAFPGHGKLKPLDEENRQLRLEVQKLKREREILKRAALFFAQEDAK